MMTNFNDLGVQELKRDETISVNGGFGILAAIAIGCAIAAFAEVVGDWDNFERGLTGKPCEQ